MDRNQQQQQHAAVAGTAAAAGAVDEAALLRSIQDPSLLNKLVLEKIAAALGATKKLASHPSSSSVLGISIAPRQTPAVAGEAGAAVLAATLFDASTVRSRVKTLAPLAMRILNAALKSLPLASTASSLRPSTLAHTDPACEKENSKPLNTQSGGTAVASKISGADFNGTPMMTTLMLIDVARLSLCVLTLVEDLVSMKPLDLEKSLSNLCNKLVQSEQYVPALEFSAFLHQRLSQECSGREASSNEATGKGKPKAKRAGAQGEDTAKRTQVKTQARLPQPADGAELCLLVIGCQINQIRCWTGLKRFDLLQAIPDMLSPVSAVSLWLQHLHKLDPSLGARQQELLLWAVSKAISSLIDIKNVETALRLRQSVLSLQIASPNATISELLESVLKFSLSLEKSIGQDNNQQGESLLECVDAAYHESLMLLMAKLPFEPLESEIKIIEHYCYLMRTASLKKMEGLRLLLHRGVASVGICAPNSTPFAGKSGQYSVSSAAKSSTSATSSIGITSSSSGKSSSSAVSKRSTKLSAASSSGLDSTDAKFASLSSSLHSSASSSSLSSCPASSSSIVATSVSAAKTKKTVSSSIKSGTKSTKSKKTEATTAPESSSVESPAASISSSTTLGSDKAILWNLCLINGYGSSVAANICEGSMRMVSAACSHLLNQRDLLNPAAFSATHIRQMELMIRTADFLRKTSTSRNPQIVSSSQKHALMAAFKGVVDVCASFHPSGSHPPPSDFWFEENQDASAIGSVRSAMGICSTEMKEAARKLVSSCHHFGLGLFQKGCFDLALQALEIAFQFSKQIHQEEADVDRSPDLIGKLLDAIVVCWNRLDRPEESLREIKATISFMLSLSSKLETRVATLGLLADRYVRVSLERNATGERARYQLLCERCTAANEHIEILAWIEMKSLRSCPVDTTAEQWMVLDRITSTFETADLASNIRIATEILRLKIMQRGSSRSESNDVSCEEEMRRLKSLLETKMSPLSKESSEVMVCAMASAHFWLGVATYLLGNKPSSLWNESASLFCIWMNEGASQNVNEAVKVRVMGDVLNDSARFIHEIELLAEYLHLHLQLSKAALLLHKVETLIAKKNEMQGRDATLIKVHTRLLSIYQELGYAELADGILMRGMRLFEDAFEVLDMLAKSAFILRACELKLTAGRLDDFKSLYSRIAHHIEPQSSANKSDLPLIAAEANGLCADFSFHKGNLEDAVAFASRALQILSRQCRDTSDLLAAVSVSSSSDEKPLMPVVLRGESQPEIIRLIIKRIQAAAAIFLLRGNHREAEHLLKKSLNLARFVRADLQIEAILLQLAEIEYRRDNWDSSGAIFEEVGSLGTNALSIQESSTQTRARGQVTRGDFGLKKRDLDEAMRLYVAAGNLLEEALSLEQIRHAAASLESQNKAYDWLHVAESSRTKGSSIFSNVMALAGEFSGSAELLGSLKTVVLCRESLVLFEKGSLKDAAALHENCDTGPCPRPLVIQCTLAGIKIHLANLLADVQSTISTESIFVNPTPSKAKAKAKGKKVAVNGKIAQGLMGTGLTEKHAKSIQLSEQTRGALLDACRSGSLADTEMLTSCYLLSISIEECLRVLIGSDAQSGDRDLIFLYQDIPQHLAFNRNQTSPIVDSRGSGGESVVSSIPSLPAEADEDSCGAQYSPWDGDFTKDLPANWTVVSISLDADQSSIAISRLRKNEQPVLVRLPVERRRRYNGSGIDSATMTYSKAIQELTNILKQSQATTNGKKSYETREEKLEWWRERRALDERLKTLLLAIEEEWFGGFKGYLLGDLEIADSDLDDFADQLETLFFQICSKKGSAKSNRITLDRSFAKSLLHLAGIDEDVDVGVLDDILHFAVHLYQLNSVLTVDAAKIDWESNRTLLQEMLSDFKRPQRKRDEHIIFVLDKHMQAFPLESMPSMRAWPISRVPCLSSIMRRMRGRPATSSAVVSTQNVFYVLNPTGDLVQTQERFAGSFSKRHTWRGIVGRAPSEEEFASALSSSDLFLYFGHGSGEQYLKPSRLRQVSPCAVTLLMGCSSGSLRLNGEFSPTGTAMAYMQNGCMSLVANLWDVTDRDIDLFSRAMLDRCGLNADDDDRDEDDNDRKSPNQAAERITLAEAAAGARDVCTLPYLNGASPIVYGVPLYLR